MAREDPRWRVWLPGTNRTAVGASRTHRSFLSSGWGLLMVPGLVIAWTLIYPIAANIWVSLHVERLDPADGTFVWLANYVDVIRYSDLPIVFWNTIVWTGGGMALQFVLGFSAALALDIGRRGTAIMRTLFITPWIMPGVAVGSVWLAIYNPTFGPTTSILQSLGLPAVNMLNEPSSAMSGVIVANGWKGFPFWMIMTAAALKTIPSDLYEAATIDGASYIQQVRYVIIPGIRVTLGLTAALAFIWTFNFFDIIFAMTRGGPGNSTTTIAISIWRTAFRGFRFDQGAALSVLSVAFMVFAIIWYVRATRLARDQ